MSRVLALLVAVGVACLVGVAMRSAAGNLAEFTANALAALLAVFSGLIAFLVAVAVLRRAGKSTEMLTSFSWVAGALGGGLIGAACGLALTTAYLTAYASWPGDLLDQILFVLAFPAFGALGFLVGACVGSLAGLISAGLLRVLAPWGR